jgi:nitroreductase
VIRTLSDKVLKHWKLAGKALAVGKRVTGLDPVFYNAPMVIFISGPRDWSYLKDDTNLAVENMFLAAHSLGLGSCWIGFGRCLNGDQEARDLLGIPDSMDIVAPLIFGFPKHVPTRIPKREPKVLKWIKA